MRQHPDYLLLLFLRVSGLVIGNPIFGRKNVPNMLKVGFCLVLTAVFMNALPPPVIYPAWNNVLAYALICLRELLFGVAMGFVINAMFTLVLAAGGMMDIQIGFSIASIYDIQYNTQSSITGSLYDIMLVVLFFGMDGHLRLIDILYSTLQTIPVGTAVISSEIMWVAAKVMSTSFALGVMLAMPVVAAGMMLEISLGVIIRTVPQMNMFVVGIPLKILVGLTVFAGTFALFVGFSRELTAQMFDLINSMFSYLRSAA